MELGVLVQIQEVVPLCTFRITNYEKHTELLDLYLKLGGPTKSKTLTIDGITFTHNLLSITGSVTPQPILYKNNLYMLLGEVYNYNKEYPSDIFSVIYNYELYGDKFTNYLDGEFLVIIYDIEKGLINFYSDPWATQMAWYSIYGDEFSFSTFQLDDNAVRLLHNSHYVFNVKDNTLVHRNSSLHNWNLTQYKDTYKDWDIAFSQAVYKRYHKTDNVVALSGGLDSSSIALCLTDLRCPFDSITLNMNNTEDKNTLEGVREYTKVYNRSIYVSSVPDMSYENNLTYDFIKSKDYLNFSFNLICLRVRSLFKKVLFTGQGSDEILDNYVEKITYNNSTRKDFIEIDMPVWPNDLASCFPYTHFYENRQRLYLDRHKYVSLAHGIEVRNPFLDKQLTQEWLNLTAFFKNKERKGPVKNFLRTRGIEIPVKKLGLWSHNIKSV